MQQVDMTAYSVDGTYVQQVDMAHILLTALLQAITFSNLALQHTRIVLAALLQTIAFSRLVLQHKKAIDKLETFTLCNMFKETRLIR